MTLHPPPPVPEPGAAPETALILLVEDEPLIREQYTDILQQAGYRVQAARDAEEGLAALKAARPDAVLLDVMMPGMGGLQALQQIRESNPDLPVLIVTASPTSEHVIAALKAGAYDFLTKGFTPDVLIRSVQRGVAHGRLLAENRRLLQSLQRQVGDLATLNAIAGLFTSTLEVDRVLTLALEQAQQALRAEGTTILLAEEGTGDLAFAVALGEKAAPLRALRLKLGEGIAGWVAATGQPCLVPDARQDPRFLSRFDAQTGLTTRSLLCVPLLGKGRVLGVLEAVNRADGAPFDQRDLYLLTSIASLAAAALENARLYQQTEARSAELKTLLQVSGDLTATLDLDAVFDRIARHLLEIIPAARSGIILLDMEHRRGLVRAGAVAEQSGVTSWVGATLDLKLHPEIERAIATRQPVVLADPGSDPLMAPVAHLVRPIGLTALLVVPVITPEGIVATLNLAQFQRPRPFTPGEVSLCQTLANHAAVAIQNARLFGELDAHSRRLEQATEERTRTLHALTAIAAAAVGTRSLPILLEEALRLTLGVLGLQHGQIRLLDPAHRELRLVACHPPEPATGPEAGPIPLGDGVAGQVALTGEPAVIVAALDAAERGGRSEVTVPLEARGTILGTLSLSSPEPRPVSQAEREFLVAVGRQIGVAVQGLRLTEESHEKSARLQALYEVGKQLTATLDPDAVFRTIARALVELFGLAQARLWLVDEPAGMMRLAAVYGEAAAAPPLGSTIPLEAGLMGQAYRAGEPIFHEEIQAVPAFYHRDALLKAGFVSFATVPIRLEARVLGTLSMFTRQRRTFTAEEREAMMALVGQAAVAMENARLFLQVRGHAASLEEKVRERTRQVEEASRHKSEFLANMSHELRTPLNAILGFSQLLQEAAFGTLSPKQARYASNIQRSGSHLLQLINDILDLSKVEAGKMELHFEPFGVPAALGDVQTIMKALAAKKSLALTTEVEPGVDQLTADPARFKQILYNLLSNAVKFTPEEGQVRVAVRRLLGPPAGYPPMPLPPAAPEPAPYLEVVVTDTGIGIDPKDRERIFEDFQQVDSSLSREHQGTGLGLSLTRKMVELHGGRIRVESELGKGSTFRFTIPEQGPRQPSAPAEPAGRDRILE
ncbi:MAG TPA: GAF domain-containing protein [Candidatus Methylomirabilis sp.]|nr:GAF domain-containing protein [Candidatus Methylomirabilis sp.]